MFGPLDSDYYRVLETMYWNGGSFCDVDIGRHVLWRGVKHGKRGGESMKLRTPLLSWGCASEWMCLAKCPDVPFKGYTFEYM